VPLAAPAAGVLLPSEFISVAEESGLIVPWASGCCTRPVGRPRLAGSGIEGIGWPVKTFSAVELRAKDFVQGVRAILPRDPLRPGLHRAGTHRDFPAQTDSTELVLNT